jgi:hypothetical protein
MFRRQIISKYKGGPEIQIFLTKEATPSENVLKAPYTEFTYPDKHPICVKIIDRSSNTNMGEST